MLQTDLTKISDTLISILNKLETSQLTGFDLFWDKGGIAVITLVFTLIAGVIRAYWNKEKEISLKKLDLSSDSIKYKKDYYLNTINKLKVLYLEFHKRADEINNVIYGTDFSCEESRIKSLEKIDNWAEYSSSVSDQIRSLFLTLDLELNFEVSKHMNSLQNQGIFFEEGIKESLNTIRHDYSNEKKQILEAISKKEVEFLEEGIIHN